MRSKVFGALSLAVAAVGLFAVAAPAFAQQKTITVWFGKGFYKSEDDALLDTIKKFEAKTGIKVELSQYAIQDMIPKTVAALDSGTVPDVAYSDTYDVQAQGKWAYEGKLEDLSDVMTPMKDRVRAEHAGSVDALQRRRQEEGLLRLPAEAAEHARPDLEGHAGEGRLQAERHPDRLGRTTGRSGATRCSRRSARPPASASTASASRWAWNPPTRSSRSTPSWTPITSSWSTMTASSWSTIPRCATA